ncbi:MAG: ferritin-like domain-containing protein [Planctomycetaceae bacterium]
MAMKTLADAFYEELRDVLSAERQLVKALPKMMKKATSESLREAFKSHLEETKLQVERVENAFEDTGRPAKAKTCEAMAGLIREAEGVMDQEADEDVMDALLIACAQKVEHYEIATYGTLCTWAEVLGYAQAKELLALNIAEEEAADEKLSELSGSINSEASA